MTPTVRTRRTQEERTAATRRALLDATIDCLTEYGYHGTTTTRVVERAGVSRGAQVHHFPTKNDLVLAAVQHLAAKRVETFLAQSIDRLRNADDWADETLDLIWDVHQGPLFDASMELWIASRTDPELREHVAAFEREITAGFVELGKALFGEHAADAEFRGDLYLVLETIRGLRLLSFVHPSSQEKLDARWQRSKSRLLRIVGRWRTRKPSPDSSTATTGTTEGDDR